jgi:hypothetical protein
MKLIYLLQKNKKNGETRNENFIIEELNNLGHDVIEIKKFFNLSVLFHLLFSSPSAVIFNSLNIGKKIKLLLLLLKKLQFPVLWWYFDSHSYNPKKQKKVELIARRTTLFFNREKRLFSTYTERGIVPIWLDQGLPSVILNNKIQINPHIEDTGYELGFFGSFSKDHTRRTELLLKLDQQYNLLICSKDVSQFKQLGFKNVKPYVCKAEIPDVVSRIKIIINLNADYVTPYCWSDRIHVMIGSGGFCLTQFIPGLSDFYLHNKHHVIFNNSEDLPDLIAYWLAQDENRDAIRLAGMEHARYFFTYAARTADLLSYAESHLKLQEKAYE